MQGESCNWQKRGLNTNWQEKLNHAKDAAAENLENIQEDAELKELLAKLWEDVDLNESVLSVTGKFQEDHHSLCSLLLC